jgi:hypothetical protein
MNMVIKNFLDWILNSVKFPIEDNYITTVAIAEEEDPILFSKR